MSSNRIQMKKIEAIRLVEVVFHNEDKKSRIDLPVRRSWGRILLLVLSVLLVEGDNHLIVVEL